MYHARLNRYLVCEWVVCLLLLATVLAFAAIRVNSRATELFGSNSSPNGSAQRHRRRPGRISRGHFDLRGCSFRHGGRGVICPDAMLFDGSPGFNRRPVGRADAKADLGDFDVVKGEHLDALVCPA